MPDSSALRRTTGQRGFYIAARKGAGATTRADALLSLVQEVATDEEFGMKVDSEQLYANPDSVLIKTLKTIAAAPIVFADLTGGDPNVYYEVAIAHALGKPVILLIGKGEKPEIDLIGDRTIQVEFNNDTVQNKSAVRNHLREALRHVRDTKEEDVFTPLRSAGIRVSLSRDPRDEGDARPDLDNEGFASWSSAPDPWILAAESGLLDDLHKEDLRPPKWIVHKQYGLGRIQRLERATRGNAIVIELRFASGASTELISAAPERDLRDVYPLRLRVPPNLWVPKTYATRRYS